MTDQNEQPDFSNVTQTRRVRKLTLRTGLIAAALVAAGIGGGATFAQMTAPTIEMAPANPVAIKTLTDNRGIITVRGKVAEIFGPTFILADGSGRALVELGRQGDGTGLVAVGQAVTVQGHFHNGMIHASFLVGADGKVTALRPMGPPHGGPDGGPDRGPGGPGFRHGPHDGGPHGGPDDGPGHGPDRGPDGAGAPPPPPPAAAPAATAPAPVTGNSAG